MALASSVSLVYVALLAGAMAKRTISPKNLAPMGSLSPDVAPMASPIPYSYLTDSLRIWRNDAKDLAPMSKGSGAMASLSPALIEVDQDTLQHEHETVETEKVTEDFRKGTLQHEHETEKADQDTLQHEHETEKVIEEKVDQDTLQHEHETEKVIEDLRKGSGGANAVAKSPTSSCPDKAPVCCCNRMVTVLGGGEFLRCQCRGERACGAAKVFASGQIVKKDPKWCDTSSLNKVRVREPKIVKVEGQEKILTKDYLQENLIILAVYQDPKRYRAFALGGPGDYSDE